VKRAMHSGFYLVVEDSIYSCFLVSEFLAAFGGSPDFLGVLSAESAPTDDILEARVQFHANHQGASDWPEATSKEWERLYQPLQQSGLAMIRLFGLPSASMSQHTNTLFLGAAVNGVPARSRVESLLRGHGIWFVTYLTHLLQPWWMELAGSRILNCHSAVLPYARGVNAIENLAADRDINAFRRAAGVTIHYIDEGVDTGPIIWSERLVDPFRFASIWELKASLYKLGIRCYVQTMRNIVERPDSLPAGIVACDPSSGPCFRRAGFTEERKRRAEDGYLWMQRRHA
jgi:phosphoribosylglycinamide formyltransferase-1